MIAFKQHSITRNEITPIEPEAISKTVKLNIECSEERSLLIIDSRSLDGQTLAGCISARMEAVWFSSIMEWRRNQVPRRFKAILMNIGGKDITDPVVAAEIKAITLATEVPTIVMSDSESLAHVVKALELGAKGYIPTSVSLEVCIEAIALSMAGGVFVPASSVLSMREHLHDKTHVTRPLNEIFTVKQAEIVEELRRGKANKIIAYELNMCESTVKVHVRNIMKKLKATNRTEVAYKLNDMFPHHRVLRGNAESSPGEWAA